MSVRCVQATVSVVSLLVAMAISHSRCLLTGSLTHVHNYASSSDFGAVATKGKGTVAYRVRLQGKKNELFCNLHAMESSTGEKKSGKKYIWPLGRKLHVITLDWSRNRPLQPQTPLGSS